MLEADKSAIWPMKTAQDADLEWFPLVDEAMDELKIYLADLRDLQYEIQLIKSVLNRYRLRERLV